MNNDATVREKILNMGIGRPNANGVVFSESAMKEAVDKFMARPDKFVTVYGSDGIRHTCGTLKHMAIEDDGIVADIRLQHSFQPYGPMMISLLVAGGKLEYGVNYHISNDVPVFHYVTITPDIAEKKG